MQISYRRKIALAALSILSIVILASVIKASGHPLSRAAGEHVETAAVPVTADRVRREAITTMLSGAGRVEGSAWVQVKPQVDGVIAEILFKEGKRALKGAPLFRLDRRLTEAHMREAAAALRLDSAQLARQRLNIERSNALFEQGFISKSALASARTDLEAAEAAVEGRRAALDVARLNWSNAVVTAPIDGIAGAAMLREGSDVKANDSVLVVLHRVGAAVVDFSLSESSLPALRDASRLGAVRVVADPGDGTHKLQGVLSFEDDSVDPRTGTVALKATFPDSDETWTPGQFVHVGVEVGRLSNALVVPASAVQAGLDGPFVFLVRADGTVASRPVVLGSASNELQSIERGLAEGDTVVSSGAARLREGSRVVVSSAARAGLDQ